MNRRVKKLWIEALRSGEYVQCRFQLDRDGVDFDEFCCLGVLTNIYCEQTAKGFEDVAVPGGLLPPEVIKWAGLKNNDPTVGNGPDDTLSWYNDNGYGFTKIADLIEKHL